MQNQDVMLKNLPQDKSNILKYFFNDICDTSVENPLKMISSDIFEMYIHYPV